MAHRPPPFAALRALEAACRHRSYTAAAAELNVTHSAVSQAVRRLEDEVGAKLFHRRGSHMEPAAASLALARAYADASQSVGRALRHISESSPNSLTVRLPARLARSWLTRLLPELALDFPTASLCVRTEGAGDPEVDLSIQPTPPRAGMEGRLFSELSLRAYASPAFLRRHRTDSPAALATAPLLIEQDGYDWAAWFAAADVTPEGALHGLRFDDNTGLALDAALRGLGVALCDDLSVASAVDRGDLAPVCPDVLAAGETLWAVWQADHPKARLVEPLAAWLCNKAADHAALPASASPALARLSA